MGQNEHFFSFAHIKKFQTDSGWQADCFKSVNGFSFHHDNCIFGLAKQSLMQHVWFSKMLEPVKLQHRGVI